MKRVKVYREGMPTKDGRTIAPGAVTLADRVPVFNVAEGGELVGLVGDLRREQGGWVTGVPSFVMPDKTALAAVILVDADATEEAISGRLGSAYLTTTPVWPGMLS
jgi:hypothetical protein